MFYDIKVGDKVTKVTRMGKTECIVTKVTTRTFHAGNGIFRKTDGNKWGACEAYTCVVKID